MFANEKLEFISSRETVRIDVEHEHATVVIHENCIGEYGPPFLVFTGKDTSVIPSAVLELEEKGVIWCDVSETGFMTNELYLRFRNRQIAWIKSKYPNDECHVCIVDNHSSHLDFDAVLLAAFHNVHDMAGPGGLTQCWQV